mmetsp:Transcript_22183/g.42312  ORF Transcript_22183/g.42312 Transcript_22183/m.42312 type:complete len:301 (+) Transcript_22183:1-903(+)
MEKVSRTIHVGGVGGLGDEIQEKDLAEFFAQYGEVTAVRISGRFAWVEFTDVRAANAALALDGETTGGHHLRVSQSKSAIHSNGLRRSTNNPAPVNQVLDPSETSSSTTGGGSSGMAGLTLEQRLAAIQNMQNIAAAGGVYDPAVLADLQAQVAAQQPHVEGQMPPPPPHMQAQHYGGAPPVQGGLQGGAPPTGAPPIGPPPQGYGAPPPHAGIPPSQGYGGMPPPHYQPGMPPPFNPAFGHAPPQPGYGPPQAFGGPTMGGMHGSMPGPPPMGGYAGPPAGPTGYGGGPPGPVYGGGYR